jgi:hypothetical protein
VGVTRNSERGSTRSTASRIRPAIEKQSTPPVVGDEDLELMKRLEVCGRLALAPVHLARRAELQRRAREADLQEEGQREVVPQQPLPFDALERGALDVDRVAAELLFRLG